LSGGGEGKFGGVRGAAKWGGREVFVGAAYWWFP